MGTNNKRILIVDDSQTMRQLIKMALHRLSSTTIEEAVDGAAGLKMLATEHYDVVLLDVNMPVMDGLTLLKTLRSTPNLAKTPVIMLTKEGMDDVKQKAGSFGVSAYLTKPAKSAEILAAVQKALAE